MAVRLFDNARTGGGIGQTLRIADLARVTKPTERVLGLLDMHNNTAGYPILPSHLFIYLFIYLKRRYLIMEMHFVPAPQHQRYGTPTCF